MSSEHRPAARPPPSGHAAAMQGVLATSSARASSETAISSPSNLAVLRLIRACSTGTSAGKQLDAGRRLRQAGRPFRHTAAGTDLGVIIPQRHVLNAAIV